MRHPLFFLYQRRPVKQRNKETKVLQKQVYFVRLCLILAVTSLYSFLIRNLFAVVGVRSRKPLDIDFFASKLSSKITDSRAILVYTLGQKISIHIAGLCTCKMTFLRLLKVISCLSFEGFQLRCLSAHKIMMFRRQTLVK